MTKQILLKIVGHDKKVMKAEWKGSFRVRLFPKGPGHYSLKLNEENQWTLNKLTKNDSLWILFKHIQVTHLLEGGTILVDEDILRLENV